MLPSKVLMSKLKYLTVLSKSIKTIPSKMVRLNGNLFSKYLLATNITISAVLSGAGDFIEQTFEIISKYQTEWNIPRTMKLAATGMPAGHFCHYWYIYLDRFYAANDMKTAVKKMLLSQFICSPICIVLFFVTLGLLNKWTKEQYIRNTVEKGMVMYLAEWIVWPAALIVSFYWLPTRYRVLYDSCFSLGLNVYYSYLVHEEFRKKNN